MKIQITVKPNARHESVEPLPDGSLKVSVNARAAEGKANEAVIEALARHFRVPKRNITIVVGAKSRKKLVQVQAVFK